MYSTMERRGDGVSLYTKHSFLFFQVHYGMKSSCHILHMNNCMTTYIISQSATVQIYTTSHTKYCIITPSFSQAAMMRLLRSNNFYLPGAQLLHLGGECKGYIVMSPPEGQSMQHMSTYQVPSYFAWVESGKGYIVMSPPEGQSMQHMSTYQVPSYFTWVESGKGYIVMSPPEGQSMQHMSTYQVPSYFAWVESGKGYIVMSPPEGQSMQHMSTYQVPSYFTWVESGKGYIVMSPPEGQSMQHMSTYRVPIYFAWVESGKYTLRAG